ncbi:hypothetical protein FNW25_16220, partial [Flavobacterium franklandianum]
MNTIFKITLTSLFFILCVLSGSAQIKQKNIARVDQMPNLPKPFQIIDYKKMAVRFDSTVYDFNAKGKYWPLVWIDKSQNNFPQDVVGLYTAVGDVRQGPSNNKGMFHESLATMGATLGASLVGIDKSNQENRNHVSMMKNYFNTETGWDIMMN